MRVEQIEQYPEIASTQIILHSGEEAVLRPLSKDDALMLGAYFLGLSEATTRVYGPHLFDQPTADRLCAERDSANTLRMLGIVEREGQERIIAYFIVHFGVYESDAKRYLDRNMPLSGTSDCELAPSVADADQDTGVGSLVMEHLIPLLRRLGRKRLVLVGGVRAENLRAIHFYEKFGFEKVGAFKTRGNTDNFDMIVSL